MLSGLLSVVKQGQTRTLWLPKYSHEGHQNKPAFSHTVNATMAYRVIYLELFLLAALSKAYILSIRHISNPIQETQIVD